MTTIFWNGHKLAADSRKTNLDPVTLVPVSYEDGKVTKIHTSCWLTYEGKKVQAFGVAGNFTLLEKMKAVNVAGMRDISDAAFWEELCGTVSIKSQVLMVVEDRIVVALFTPVNDGMVKWEINEGPRDTWMAIGSGADVLSKRLEVMGAEERAEFNLEITTIDIFKSMGVFSMLDAFTGGPTYCWDGEKIVSEARFSSQGGLLRELIDFCTDAINKRFDATQFKHLIRVYFYENPKLEANQDDLLKNLQLDQFELV